MTRLNSWILVFMLSLVITLSLAAEVEAQWCRYEYVYVCNYGYCHWVYRWVCW
jgi:hypothetical protein